MRTRIHLCIADADSPLAGSLVERLRQPVTGLILEPATTRGWFHSQAAEDVRAILAEQIRRAAALACIVGPAAVADPWVDWEVTTALEAGVGLAAVRIRPGAPDFLPRAILHAGAPVVHADPWSVIAVLERVSLASRTGPGNK